MRPGLCIVIPVLNEAATLGPCLHGLRAFRARGSKVVVVDGGSDDDTLAIARDAVDRGDVDLALSAPRGRASQMNAGAAALPADGFLFLHADTTLPDRADALVRQSLAGAHAWGRFDVRIASERPLLRAVATTMNLRSRWTGIATGDQALFVRADLFERLGGFPDLALMEDIALSKRLRAHGQPACLRAQVTTSARRWELHGTWRTILLMWRLRAAYFLGADPRRLATRYGDGPRSGDRAR